jgi:hypothetical protein
VNNKLYLNKCRNFFFFIKNRVFLLFIFSVFLFTTKQTTAQCFNYSPTCATAGQITITVDISTPSWATSFQIEHIGFSTQIINPPIAGTLTQNFSSGVYIIDIGYSPGPGFWFNYCSDTLYVSDSALSISCESEFDACEGDEINLEDYIVLPSFNIMET